MKERASFVDLLHKRICVEFTRGLSDHDKGLSFYSNGRTCFEGVISVREFKPNIYDNRLGEISLDERGNHLQVVVLSDGVEYCLLAQRSMDRASYDRWVEAHPTEKHTPWQVIEITQRHCGMWIFGVVAEKWHDGVLVNEWHADISEFFEERLLQAFGDTSTVSLATGCHL